MCQSDGGRKVRLGGVDGTSIKRFYLPSFIEMFH